MDIEDTHAYKEFKKLPDPMFNDSEVVIKFKRDMEAKRNQLAACVKWNKENNNH